MATGRPISVAIDEENDVATFSATHTHVLPIQLVSMQQCTASNSMQAYKWFSYILFHLTPHPQQAVLYLIF